MNQVNLNQLKIRDIAHGRELLEAIAAESSDLMRQMREAATNTEWQALENRKYDLKKARHTVQDQMTSMVRAKFGKKRGL